MDSTRDIDVLVVGAGPTGLTLATVLARAGVDCTIVDGKAGPVDETRALVVQAKTLELLDKLGLARLAVAEGKQLGAIALVSAGRRAGEIALFGAGGDDRTPFPFVLVYDQRQTERLLGRAIAEAGGRVDWGTELLSLAPGPTGSRATLRRPDGAVEAITARWVVGADGARSPVRHALELEFAGDTYEQSLFLADVDLAGALGADQATMELTADGFLAFFPFATPGRFRIFGTLPPTVAGDERITAEELQGVLDQHSRLRPTITEARWTSAYRTHHRMTERFRRGRVFLAGDAAHIHSPAGGQGMNTGIGDAYNLGWKLALVASGRARETLLDSYEAERMPFARAILNGSDRAFHLVATTSPVGQRVKLLALPALFRLASRLPPLRRRLFWLVSQLWTSYRGSPAVAGTEPRGGGPRAGDRAPFGHFTSGGDAGTSLFARLTGSEHHLLVFAGRRPATDGLREARLEIAALLARWSAPVRLHSIPAAERRLHRIYGVDLPTLILVRPDGHVGYRGSAADLAAFARYLDGLFVPRSEATGQSPAAFHAVTAD